MSKKNARQKVASSKKAKKTAPKKRAAAPKKDEGELARTRQLRVRMKLKARKPAFHRQEDWRYKRLDKAWRRPKGIDSKMRVGLGGWPQHISTGYRSPKKVRYFHPSGKEEMVVSNAEDLSKADSKRHVIRIAHTVGSRKRMKILERAEELKLRVVNYRGAEHETEE